MTEIDFGMEINLEDGTFIKEHKVKKLPFDKHFGAYILPLKILKKYHYCNINMIILMPNYLECLYNNFLYPISVLDIEANDYQKDLEDYIDMHKYTVAQSKFYPQYGEIICENSDLYIMGIDEKKDGEVEDAYYKITNIIPEKYMESKSYEYYYKYCQENNTELFGILNEVFQINFKNLDITLN